MTFDHAFDILLDEWHEGRGYTSAAQAARNNDPGGETRFGISKRSYPDEDIANLTIPRAKELYLRDFWIAVGCDAVPEVARFDLFDMAVHSGPTKAKRLLQEAVGVKQDLKVGPVTRAAIAAMPEGRFVARFNGLRLIFLANLKNWRENSAGWARRIAANLLKA